MRIRRKLIKPSGQNLFSKSVPKQEMNGATIVSNQAVANLGLDWHVLGTGDFNADGRTDVLLQHNGGQVVMWQMNGSSIVSHTFSAKTRERL